MSILDQDELEQLDYVKITTQDGGRQVSVTTPRGKGCTTTVLGSDGRPLKWEVREGAGLSGATQSYRGKGLLEFSIQIEMTGDTEQDRVQLRGDWEQFDQIVEASPPGLPAKVYLIGYPILALRGVTNCVFLNEPLLDHDKTTQIDKIVYKCREHRMPQPSVSSTTAPDGTAEGAAKDEFAQKVASRASELETLASQAGLLGAPGGGG